MRDDLRAAVRSIIRRPLFAATVIGSLALGLGASLAIFSVLDTLMLRRIPVRDPGALFQIVHAGDAGTSESTTQALYEHLRTHATTIDGLLQVDPTTMNVIAAGEAEALTGQAVSPDYFTTLGVSPLLGSVIEPSRSAAGAAPDRVAVLSHRYWTRRFGADPGVLGRTITVDRTPHTIVGVTRPGFFGLQVGRHVDVTVPLDPTDDRIYWQSKAIIVRVRAGVDAETARAELDRLFGQYVTADTVLSANARTRHFRRLDLTPAASGLPELRDRYGRPLVATLAIVSALLLLACANLATMFLARTAARQGDLAVALALGASRTRLARPLLAEALLLALAGGSLGLIVAAWGVDLLVAFVPDLRASGEMRFVLDGRLLLVACGVAGLTGVAIGAAPALLAGRADLRTLVAAGGRAIVFGGRTFRSLVAAQVTLSTLLVIAALLLTSTLSRLKAQPMGFEAEGVLLMTLDADGADLDEDRLAVMQGQALERLRRLPGVRHATMATIPPLSGNEDGKLLAIPGVPLPSPDAGVLQVNTVGSEFFETFRVPIVRGRGITDRDTRTAPRVAVVSESMAAFYFPGVDAIGRRIDIGRQTGGQIEIVGVARDVRYRNLRTPAPRIAYVPAAQRGAEESLVFALRTTGDPADRALAAQREIRAVAPGIPVTDVTTLTGARDRTLVNERLLATLSSCFGVLALLLAGLGVYGIVAYSVAGRTAEIGVRVTLGASRAGLVWLVVRGALSLTLVAAAAGALAAFLGRSLITTFLFGIAPSSPWVYSGTLAVLLAIALLAAVGPTLRALRIDPVDTLRRS